MKWWVGLLALLLVLFFGSLGMLYVRTFVVHRPHGVILFVANGLDISLLNEARHQAAARGQRLNLDNLERLCVLDVEGLDQPIPDEAAASTALACGKRVRNGLVGVTIQKTNLNTLIYAAQQAGRSTGLITTRQFTAPTPLAFYGRTTPGQPGYELRSAAELIDSSGIDILLGGGAQYFTPAHILNERGRIDGRDLVSDAVHNGYTTVQDGEELRHVPTWRTRQLLGLFAPGDLTFSALRRGSSSQPSLEDMTRMAIKCLQYNIGGYFLVIEQGLIGNAARHNWTDLALGEIAALDTAIGTARQYAGDQSLVLVTNNFSLGTLDQIKEEVDQPVTHSGAASGIADAGRVGVAAPSDAPQWLSGPGGVPQKPQDKLWLKNEIERGAFSADPRDLLYPASAVRFTRRAEITSAPAWLGAAGLGADRFSGFFANDQVFGLVQDLF